MDDAKFQELLANKGVVIVHFSHFAVMSHYVEFPYDLEHAIAFHQSETRSCCALWPTHNMELPGSVGIIFKPTFEQVLSVLADDSGSSNSGDSESSGGLSPSEETILASLNVPQGRYNEWRVRGATPAGIFIANTRNICVKKKMQFPVNGEMIEDIGCTGIAVPTVFDAFPNMPIFTWEADGIVCIRANGI